MLNINDFDGVAFDVEGTLANTIPMHHYARMKAFAKHGFGHITRDQHALGPTYGSSHYDVLGGVLYAAGEIDDSVPFHKNQTVLDVTTTTKNLFRNEADKGFDAMPGAINFIKMIEPHFKDKMILVTSSEEDYVIPFINKYGLGRYFNGEKLIGNETVENLALRGKPNPDPYELAKKRLKSKKLLVFEDTAPGVESAKKADTTVIALGFDKANSKLFRSGGLKYPPDYVVENYDQAAELLGL
jgi:HAD superfamily hydrolase (TIGR01509 family)